MFIGKMEEERFAVFHRIFKQLDSDNNGFISVSCLGEAFSLFGSSKSSSELVSVLSSCGISSETEGEPTLITFPEFTLLLEGGKKSKQEDPRLRELFDSEDHNHNGELTHEQLKKCLLKNAALRGGGGELNTNTSNKAPLSESELEEILKLYETQKVDFSLFEKVFNHCS